MGPEFWKQDKETRLKKCSEKSLTCNDSETNTDGCCSVIACKYCVTWEEYGEPTVSDKTNSGDGMWQATPGGIEFAMWWERDPYTGDCELVVTFDNDEVYRKSCYEGQSCRDSSDFVEVDLPYLEGTLTWTKDLQRPLPNIRDYQTNCIRQLCSDCTCTCECFCVSVVKAYDCSTTLGEICDTAYDCDKPVWSGTVGEYAIEVSLDDDCGLLATVDGVVYAVEIEPYTSLCDNFQATITLADDTVITLRCKECQCEEDGNCGVGCCWPKEITPLYPCGYLVPVPFEITAPGCDIDGRTGTFTPGGVVDVGSCGACADSPDTSAGTTIGSIKVPNPYLCNDTPCSMNIFLRLACEDGAASCCGGFKLWVGTSERMVGWTGLAPAGGDPNLYWIKYSPTSCACDPLAMIFDVSFTLDCPDTWVGGTCDGQPKDCCDPVCGGFTLTI